MKHVLTIDGGGMRGFIPAAVLVELERRTGKPCWTMFDLMAGTSIGGIIVALLSAGVPAKDAIEFFTKDGPKIFKKHWWRAFGLMLPRYPARPIELVLQKRFDGLMLKGCRTKLLITSLELQSQLPIFFKNFGDFENEFVWKAARATSAAQTYFPAFRDSNPSGDRYFWDGGNVANNPAMCAYADAVKLWGDQEPMKFLSLGCGNDAVNLSARKLVNGSAIRAAAATIGMLFEAGSEDVDYQMAQLLDDDYIRIQPELSQAIALDDASEDGISKLNAAALNCLRKNSKALDHFIATL